MLGLAFELGLGLGLGLESGLGLGLGVGLESGLGLGWVRMTNSDTQQMLR